MSKPCLPVNRMFFNSLLFVALLGVAASPVHPSNAQDVLFSEDFESGVAAGWTFMDDPEPQSGPGNWDVLGGELRQSSNIWSYGPVDLETKYHLGTHGSAGDMAWTDYTLNATLRSSDNDGMGLLVRYQDERNYYRVLVMNDPAWSGRDMNGQPVNSALQRIQKFVDGEPVTLAENLVSSAWPPGYFSLSVDVRGDSIRAFLDGKLILAARDTTFSGGRIGVMSYANTGAHYDDIQVTRSFTLYDAPDRSVTYPVRADRMPYVQNPSKTSFELAWRTLTPAIGMVRVGTEKGVLHRELYSGTDSSAATAGSPVGPRQKHHVVVDGLDPSTRYYYEVVNDGVRMQPEEDTRTARLDTETRFSFLVLGDSGVGTETQQRVSNEMRRSMNQSEVDFVVHVGDVHQGSGDYYDDIYFTPYRDIIKNVNVFTVLGNHDVITDNGAIYLDDFYLPRNNAENTERYYAYRWGHAFFIALDTNIDYAPGSPQHAFLLEALESEERKGARWTFVSAHHPPWTEYWTNYFGDERVRELLVPIFETHGVDMVMNGHTHSYERGERGHVHYLVSGGGGGGLDDFFVDYNHITFSAGVHHFTRIDLDGDEMTVTATDENGAEVDRFLINKRVAVDVDGRVAANLPDSLTLEAPWPNPAGDRVTLRYTVPRGGRVQAELFDSAGRNVMRLVDRIHPMGTYATSFDVSGLAPGTYVVRFRVGADSEAHTLIVQP